MPEYLAPGVYVEETSFRSKSIEGVSTTTTGFVGPARYGPVTEAADVITSLGEFERTYAGGGQLAFRDPASGESQGDSDNYLWHAARAFFFEGGRRLYIARVFRPLPNPNRPEDSQEDYPPNFDTEIPYDYHNSATDPLWADGHARGAIGNLLDVRARFPGEASNLIVRFNVHTGQNLLGAVPDPDAPSGRRPKLGAISEGDVVFIESQGSLPTAGYFRVRRDTVDNVWRFAEVTGSPSDVIGSTVEELGLDPNPNPGQGDSIFVVTVTVTVLSSDRDHDLGTWADLPFDPNHERNGEKDSAFARFRSTPATLSEGRSLPIVFSVPKGTNGVEVLEALQAAWLAFDPARTTEQWFEGLVEGNDFELILLGGNDGQRPGAREYEGTDDQEKTFKTGLKQFEDVDDISIVAAPGSTADYDGAYREDANAIYGLLINHATQMRYRIAVLDSPPAMSVGDIRRVRAKLDSKYAALYYPWVIILDPITRAELNLPPSGFVAGIYARNDIQRAVWKAPANEVVNLAIGFEQILNKSQQEVLNPEGINCFRYFEGRGFRLWGARTISSDPEWKYVNIRRYFVYLEHSVDKGTQWAVFEPNGEALWANVRRTVEDFLLNEWQSGALLGDKPEKAFFVRCDRSTMTQNDLDNGRLICLVGVAPLYPAEFVIFRIGQWTADRKV
jgi:phage tail sheath protein FI